MESALAVANYFIRRSLETGYEVTPMKAIKLVYIAHGWHLGFIKKPLLEEGVQAWQFGPVVESVYKTFKKYGASKIDKEASVFPFGINKVKNPSALHLLGIVWDKYGKMTGTQLSSLTHQKGTPWDIVWNTIGRKELFTIIPNDLIQEHYEGLIKQRSKVHAE